MERELDRELECAHAWGLFYSKAAGKVGAGGAQEPTVLPCSCRNQKLLRSLEPCSAGFSDALQGDTFYFRKENFLRKGSDSHSCPVTSQIVWTGCRRECWRGGTYFGPLASVFC